MRSKDEESKTARIFSLLGAVRADETYACLAGQDQWQVIEAPQGDWQEEQYWQSLGAGPGDVVLVGLTQGQVWRVIDRVGEVGANGHRRRPWNCCEGAVVAVLEEGDLSEAQAAAQLDFDGLLAEPADAATVVRQLTMAQRRAQRRVQLDQRYGRVRKLCRAVNRKRRSLQEQMELLCSDLVNSNMQFTETLMGMQRVYDLLYGLTGEFDVKYLLYKGLKAVKAELGGASVAVYVCGIGGFEAHVSGPWYDAGEVEELEEQLAVTLVERVLRAGEAVLVADGGQWEDIGRRQRESLAGLSLLGLPVAVEGEVLGVVVAYRPSNEPLGMREQRRVGPMMEPLGRAMEAAVKVGHLADGM